MRVECTLFLSSPLVVCLVRPTPMVTCDMVPCGVAQLQVLSQCDDPIDTMAEVLQENPSKIHLKIHLVKLAPTLEKTSSFCCNVGAYVHRTHLAVFLALHFLAMHTHKRPRPQETHRCTSATSGLTMTKRRTNNGSEPLMNVQ